MRRREFVVRLLGAAAAWPTATLAQQRTVPAIGYLHSGSPTERAEQVEAFLQGLKEGGYTDGKNVAIEYRWAQGHYGRLQQLAAELVKLKVVVIVASTTPAGVAAKAATSTIPIVFRGGGDPVKLGLVKTLGRPGGNATGIADLASSLEAKRLQVLRDLLPATTSIGYLVNPKFPGANALINEVKAAGAATATKVQILSASTEDEIDAAFAAAKQGHVNALLVSTDPYFVRQRDQITILAARYAIPSCYAFREFVDAGGLMSYGPDLVEGNRQQGRYTARILKGAKPADLPVIQVEKFELALNRKAVDKLGIVVPQLLLLRVDRVIE